MNTIKLSVFATILSGCFFLFSCSSDAPTETVEVETETEEVEMEATTYSLSPENTDLMWIGKKVTGQHNGEITDFKGSVEVVGDKLVAGSAKVDMKSLVVLDLEDPESNADLTGHLMSADFFDVENHQMASLEILGSDENMAKGNLTIKGVTNPVAINYNISNGVLEGKMDVDRTAYGIKYGSGKFFEDLGDKMINDNFILNFVVKLN